MNTATADPLQATTRLSTGLLHRPGGQGTAGRRILDPVVRQNVFAP